MWPQTSTYLHPSTTEQSHFVNMWTTKINITAAEASFVLLHDCSPENLQNEHPRKEAKVSYYSCGTYIQPK